MKRVFFISGHRDITSDEFEEHYVSEFKRLIDEIPEDELVFVVGDYYGVDEMAQKWLAEYNVTVYHMFDSPRTNAGNHPTVGGFTSDIERDTAMTNASEADIAWIRPGKESSGTAQNIERRLQSTGNTFHFKGTVVYDFETDVVADSEDVAKQILDDRISQGAVTLKLTSNPNERMLRDFAQYVDKYKKEGLDLWCQQREVDSYLKAIENNNGKLLFDELKENYWSI